ncbi:MAG TPA: PASTA domain-containing protein [Solirubrobacteraceae bacterium]|nr:PASTA domain-containing protein [Solirubrobacteraceae bacterium]
MPARLSLAVLAVLAAAALAAPAPASAAATLGQTGTGGGSCSAGSARAQVASAAPRYTVELYGVITQLRTAAPVAGVRLHVLRPRGGNAYAVLASAPVAAGSGIVAAPVRVPVQPGDVLGLSTSADLPNCLVPGGGSSDVTATGSSPGASDPEVTLAGTSGGRLNVAATLEPDADGDAHGDETQDRCPDDPTRTAQECSADLLVTQVPVEREVERDDVNVIAINVRNAGTSLARDVRVTAALPPGLQLLSATPSSGGCAQGSPLDCTLPAIPAGGTGQVVAVVRAVATGVKTLTTAADSSTPDPNPANNTAEVEFDVRPRRAVVQPGAFCRVPRLLGLSRTAARRALEAAGCRLGLTTRRRFPSGRYSRVKRQSIPARTRVATGTRVNVVLRAR